MNGSGNWGQWPAVTCDQIGHVGVAWIQASNVQFRQSDDFGASWQPAIQVTADGAVDAVCCDIAIENDLIYLTWMKNQIPPPGLESICFTKSSDNGQNWDDPYWIDRDHCQSLNPTMAIATGRIHVIWVDWRADPDTNVLGSVYFSRWPDWPDAVDEDEGNLPDDITLSARPNPFNAATTISYRGLEPRGSLHIYDITGRLVRRLMLDQTSGALVWNATDDGGEEISSGVYMARITNTSISQTLKLLYIK